VASSVTLSITMARVVTTRRELLAAGVTGGASFLLAACGVTTRKAASVAPAGSDLGAIEHVVFLMQENRSFDHYFGSYRGVKGFDDHPPGSRGVFEQAWPGGPASSVLPFHLDTTSTDAECTYDLSHAWDVQHRCWNNGAMDRFVATHVDPQVEGPANGVLTMGYYTRQDLGFYYALADAFTIGDGYHSSVMGPTGPNRLYALSGTIDPGGLRGGPAIGNGGSNTQFAVSWRTMPEQLEGAGVSWKTYNPPGRSYQPSNPYALVVSDNILLSFKQYQDPSSALYQKAFVPVYPRDFVRDVAHDTLPQVAWIMPPNGYDEHPPAAPPLGMMFAHDVLDTLVSNPKIWAKTVLFIMHDENDGFFDHVPPPTPPPGTPGEYLRTDPLSPDAGGIAGPIGLGFRVPLLVVSPFSRGGYVCSDTFDHTSQLKFLETRFGVRAPNVSAWRRNVVGDLTSTLQFDSPDTIVPRLPVTLGRRDPRVVGQCNATQLAGSNPATAPYLATTTQQMPSQERGQALRKKG
jgi:phospholipase C